MERKPNHIKKKRNAPKPQLGKAILVDGDGNDNLFLVEGKQESWLLQTYQVFSGHGIAVGFRKSDLSADENNGFALLLGAMQNEQAISTRMYKRIIEENGYMKELVEADPQAAASWKRYTDIENELTTLGRQR